MKDVTKWYAEREDAKLGVQRVCIGPRHTLDQLLSHTEAASVQWEKHSTVHTVELSSLAGQPTKNILNPFYLYKWLQNDIPAIVL